MYVLHSTLRAGFNIVSVVFDNCAICWLSLNINHYPYNVSESPTVQHWVSVYNTGQ